jgi:outer membrane receptor protein involved in Fe transport
MTLYATYRHGFQSGGFNQTAFNVAGSDNSYNPMKVRGGEVGAKGIVFGRQLQFASAAYYYKYKGLQLSSYDSASGSFKIQNAGRATIYGLELSGTYVPEPVPGLSIRGALNYNHGRYDEFPATCYPGQTIEQGCNLLPVDGVFQAQNLKGRPLVRAMDWSGTIGTTYEREISTKLKFSASADALYTGPYYAMLEEAPASRQSKFWKLNASVALRAADDSWEVAVIGTNLTNELNYTIVQGTPLTGSGQGTNGPARLSDLSAVLGDPRSVMIRLTLRR